MAKDIYALLTITFICLHGLAEAVLTRSDSSLESVHVVFRHGDRTPDRHILYPTDPYINHTYSPVGFGQLTNAGKIKEYLIGKALRKRYRHFLGKFHVETIDARCTNYNRTKASLQLVLASLFPPEDDLIWEKGLKWQPVPFNYWPVQEDHILGEPYKNCPRFRKLYLEYTRKENELYHNFSHVINYTAHHSGMDPTSRHFAYIHFSLATEAENGLELPEWTRRIHPHITTRVVISDYIVSTSRPELKKLAAGFLIQKIIDDTRAKVKNPSHRTKMYLYSAHEYNIAYLLRFLGVYYDHIPSYGAYLTIEVHNFNGVRGIKVFYQDYKNDKPRRMRLPLCENFCRLERFLVLYGNYLPASEKECFD